MCFGSVVGCWLFVDCCVLLVGVLVVARCWSYLFGVGCVAFVCVFVLVCGVSCCEVFLVVSCLSSCVVR